MAPRTIYANLQDGLNPLSLWDQSLADMGNLGIIPCTAAGANAIVLTPIASVNAPNLQIPPQTLQAFSFIAAANSTAPVTLKVDGNPAKNVYKSDGITQLGAGDISSGRPYQIIYSPSLNSSVGGFYLQSEATSAADLTFTQAGTGAVTRSLSGKVGETFSVTDFGALGTADDSPTFIAAIAAASAAGGGMVMVPVGVFTARGLTLPNGVTLQGAGKNATYLTTKSVDSAIITIAGTKAGIADMALFGKGVNNDTGSFGSSNPTLAVTGVENDIRRVLVLGGQFPIYAPGTDNLFEDVNSSDGFGSASVAIVGGANWFVRCKFDHTTQGVTLTDTAPFSTNWASGTPYTVGQVRIVGSYLLVCSVGGTSGGVAPTLKNYLVNIVDNTVTWLLLAPATYSALLVGAGSGENHLTQIDFSGPYSTSLLVQATAGSNGPGVVCISNSIFSSPIQITNGNLVILRGNELGSSITVDTAYAGKLIIDGNSSVGSANNVTVGANVNNFAIVNNFFNGGMITVAAGTSDFYVIDNNPNATVSDSGTGVHKVVGTFAGQTYASAASIQAPSITLRNASGFTSDIRFGVAGTSGATLTVAGASSGSQVWQTSSVASGTIIFPTGSATLAPLASPQFTGTINAAAMSMSGQLNIIYANATAVLQDSGTSFVQMEVKGGGMGGFTVGQEGSGSGGNLIAGSAAGDGVLNISDNKRFVLGANNTVVFYINPSGGLGLKTATDPGAGSFLANASIKSQGATAGIGYATGAGGTVAQATSKATGVTLSTASGQITMNNAALAAATIVSFVLTNTAIAATDVLVLNHISGGTVGSYTLNAQCAAGSATINVRNNTAGSLSEAIVIQFALIKAVNS